MSQQQEQEFADFEIQANLNEVDAWGGEQRPLVPPGDYILQLVMVKNDTAKSSGAAKIAVTFEVMEGEHKGSKVWNNYNLSEVGMKRLKSLVVACGGSLDQIRASELMGQTIRASIVHNEGNSQPDANGNPQPPKIFANVINEMPLEEAEAPKAAKTAAPPITRATQTKPAANGAARRA